MALLSHLTEQVTVSEHLYTLQSDLPGRIDGLRENIEIYSNYKLSEHQRELLENFGISTTDRPKTTHAHPASATIENYILHVVIPGLLNSITPQNQVVGFMWSKDRKHASMMPFISRATLLNNSVLTTKDLSRYSSNPTSAPLVDCRTLFVHDSGHFMNQADVYNLFFPPNHCNLQNAVFTIIIPPELLKGMRPQYPDVYTFKRNSDHFVYMPDGHVAGNYTQSISCLWWLTTNSIVGPRGTLTLTILDTYFAHHIIHVTSNTVLPPNTNYFQTRGRIMPPNHSRSFFFDTDNTINRKVFETCVNYALSVNTTKEYQVMARGRAAFQLSNGFHLSSDALAATEYGYQIALNRENFGPTSEIVSKPIHYITRCGPIGEIKRVINAYKRIPFDATIAMLQLPDHTIEIKLSPYYLTSLDHSTVSTHSLLPGQSYYHIYELTKCIIYGSYVAQTPNAYLGAGSEMPSSLDQNYYFRLQRFFSLLYEQNEGPLHDAPFSHLFSDYLLLLFFSSLPKLHIVRILYDQFFVHIFYHLIINAFHLNHTYLLAITPLLVLSALLLYRIAIYLPILLKTKLHRILSGLKLYNFLPNNFKILYYNISYNMTPKKCYVPETPPFDNPIDTTITPPTQTISANTNRSKPRERSAFSHKTHNTSDHICKQLGCSEHNSSNNTWTTCLSGHGFSGVKGNPCHLCPDGTNSPTTTTFPLNQPTLIGTTSPISNNDNTIPRQKQLLTHPPVLGSPARCVLKNVHFTNIDCAMCLGKHRNLKDYTTPNFPKANTCLFKAVSDASGFDEKHLWEVYCHGDNARGIAQSHDPCGYDEYDVTWLAIRSGLRIIVVNADLENNNTDSCMNVHGNDCDQTVTIHYTNKPGHFFYKPPEKTPMYNGATTPTRYIKTLPQLLREFNHKAWFDHPINYRRADKLLRNIETGCYGEVLPKKIFLHKQLGSVIKTHKRRHIKISYICGTFGAGKTRPCLEIFNKVDIKSEIFRVICPTVTLRDDVKEKLHLPPGTGYKVQTFETPFFSSRAKLLLIDEIGKYGPGYIDLLCAYDPTISHVIVTGDPCQAVYHCTKEDNTLASTTPEIDYLAPYACMYLPESTRPCCDVAHYFGFKHICRKDSVGTYKYRKGYPTHNRVLVAGHVENQTLLEFGRHSSTFSSSQGLTITKPYSVIIDRDSAKCDDRLWYTAISRGTTSLEIVNTLTTETPRYYSSILRAICTPDDPALIKSAINQHIIRYVPKQLLDLNAPPCLYNGGFEHSTDPTKLVTNHPQLQGIAVNYTDTPPEEPSFTTPSYPQPHFANPHYKSQHDTTSTVLQEAIAHLTGTLNNEVNLFSREIKYKNNYTTQVDDTNFTTASFLRHRRGDVATEQMTNEGRWVKEKKIGNKKNFQNRKATGLALFQALISTYDIKPQTFNETLWQESVENFQTRFSNKGEKRINAIADRADPQWPDTYAETFMKGQSVTKPGTYGRIAKKGQLVISFNTATNFRWGPLARYLSVIFKQVMPANVFTLDGNTDTELSEFIRKYWDFNLPSFEDDYEAYDSSQDHEFLNFDYMLMQYLGVPTHMIQEYLDFMLNIRTWMGRMGGYLPSGFSFTLLLNTWRSLAYMALKYFIKRLRALCATGDDSAGNGTLTVRALWSAYYDNLFILKCKTSFPKYPTFCGWKFSPHGCYKEPTLLLDRTLYQLAKGNLDKCIFNYMADATPLHVNIEILAPFLSEPDLEAHLCTVSLLVGAAKQHNINLLGDFLTTYGVKKNYNLRYNGGSDSISGPNIDTNQTGKFKESFLSPTYSIQRNSISFQMPYTVHNLHEFQLCENARWWSIQQANELNAQLLRCQYKIVRSRDEVDTFMVEWLARGQLGTAMFSETTEFPSETQDIFITDKDQKTMDILGSIIADLTWRKTAFSKATLSENEQRKAANSHTNNEPPHAYDQEEEDHYVAYRAHVTEFSKLIRNRDLTWNRASFELRTTSAFNGLIATDHKIFGPVGVQDFAPAGKFATRRTYRPVQHRNRVDFINDEQYYANLRNEQEEEELAE